MDSQESPVSDLHAAQPNFTTGVFQKVFETFLVTFFPFPCVCVLVHILG